LNPNRFHGTEGQDYLQEVANSSSSGFERRFGEISTTLRLGETLNRLELGLLFNAASKGMLCYIAFNGLGESEWRINPKREANRMFLEREFTDETFAKTDEY